MTDDEVLDPTYCPDRPDIPPVQAKRGRGRPRKEKPAGLEEVQAQLTELLQKQASERNRFQDELDAQREQLNELRKAMPRPQVIVIDEDEPDVQTVKERSVYSKSREVYHHTASMSDLRIDLTSWRLARNLNLHLAI